MATKTGEITKLARIMFERQVSTLELSQTSGISAPLISLIKNGWKKPTPQQSEKIEKALGVSQLFDSISIDGQE